MSFWSDYNCNRYDPDSHENRIVCDSEYVTEKELSDAKDLIIETTKEYADEYTVDQAKEHAEALQTAFENEFEERAGTFENGIDTRVTAVENAETAHVAEVTETLNGFGTRVTAVEGDVTSLGGRVTDNESDIAENSRNIETINDDLSVVNKTINLNNYLTNNISFKFGYMTPVSSTYTYNNGITTDGTYIYMSFASSDNTLNGEIIKFNMAGEEITKTAAYTKHGQGLAYNSNDNNLYVYGGDGKIYKYSTDLEYIENISLVAEIVNVGVRSIKFDNNNNGYVITRTEIHKFNSDFTELIETINSISEFQTEKQEVAIFDDYLFYCSNYPNVIAIYRIVDNDLKFVKSINIGGIIDNTYVGEIEGIEVTKIDNKLKIYFSTVKSMFSRYYNELFEVNSDINDSTNYKENIKNSKTTVYYVDGTYTGVSNGTSSKPWKSLTEAFCHCALKSEYEIYLVNANTTIDAVTGSNTTPPGNYKIHLSSPLPNSNIRWYNSNVLMSIETNETFEVSFMNSFANVYYGSGVTGNNLTVTNRNSFITIEGNVKNSYNLSGVSMIKGTATTTSGDNYGVNIANAITTDSKGTNIKIGSKLGF